jgi:hypothetical protein
VSDLDRFIEGLAGSGWYLHPHSLRTIRDSRTAWLARPGTPFLVEVQEREDSSEALPLVTRLEVPLSDREREMISALGIEQVTPSSDNHIWIGFGEHRILLDELLKA